MKQKNPATKNQRYLAVFLALTMLLSAGAIFFSGNNSNKDKSDNNSSSGNIEENNTIAFSQIPGRQVHHEFNSIADGLNMSPKGVVSASYIDCRKRQELHLNRSLGIKQ